MKRSSIWKVIGMSVLLIVTAVTGHGQSNEATQLLLNWEKLKEMKAIYDNMVKGYQILSNGYNKVKGVSQGNFSMHQLFLDGLMQVSPAVRNYRRVPEVINSQIQLVSEYKGARKRFNGSGVFTVSEMAYLGDVYDHLFKESLRNLDELLTVVTAGQLRMNDDERLVAIDRIADDMKDKVLFLRSFNGDAAQMGYARAKQLKDADAMAMMYDLK